MGDSGNALSMAFEDRGKLPDSMVDDTERARRASIRAAYGDNEHANALIQDPDKKPDYAPVDISSAYDEDYVQAIRKHNIDRARWSDLSDAERTASADDYKMADEGYKKRDEERKALQKQSILMDQRELRSRAASNRVSNPGGAYSASKLGTNDNGSKTPLTSTLAGKSLLGG